MYIYTDMYIYIYIYIFMCKRHNKVDYNLYGQKHGHISLLNFTFLFDFLGGWGCISRGRRILSYSALVSGDDGKHNRVG